MPISFVTSHVEKIKIVFDILKDFGKECVIFFSKDGVNMIGVNKASIIEPRYYIPVEDFSEYNFNELNVIKTAILTKTVSSLLKRRSAGDQLEFGLEERNSKEFFFKSKTYKANIISVIPDENIIVEPINFDFSGTISLKSSHFNALMADISTTDDKNLKIECDGHAIKFSGNGIYSTVVFDIPLDGQEATLIRTNNKWPVSIMFPLYHIMKISKAKNMAKNILMSIGSNMPAKFEYISDFGIFSFLLCPRVQDDETIGISIDKVTNIETTDIVMSEGEDVTDDIDDDDPFSYL